MPDYDRGDTARLSLAVKDPTGTLVDPATLTLTIRTPAGVTTAYTSPAAPIVKDATGTYHADVALIESGAYVYQWQSTAPDQVQGGTLEVLPGPLDTPSPAQIARARLANMVAANEEPTLDAVQINDLLALASVPDANGVAAADPGWTPTYDLNCAAAEGWRWKAAKAASSYAFTLDGDSTERSFLMIRCEHMADRYSKLIMSSIPVNTGLHLPSFIPLT